MNLSFHLCFSRLPFKSLFKNILLKEIVITPGFTNYFNPEHHQWIYSQVLGKGGLPSQNTLNMVFPVFSGKVVFFFPENMILFGRNIKDDPPETVH